MKTQLTGKTFIEISIVIGCESGGMVCAKPQGALFNEEFDDHELARIKKAIEDASPEDVRKLVCGLFNSGAELAIISPGQATT